ncbi:MAG: hypothetical protein MPEBLZ_01798 [Candidatus Methanoperedens nitroreducens]|uniref:Uncharacterized protein n=1 Tax=Candidatus Methanoperedens nitratireducens TaxID=1392998 RepID=A0A0P8CA02_9EURY|nr:MAG: hypothetical protein MPEBLZ_01798 [Candidatus Methanoperedens sp. BLZ1]
MSDILSEIRNMGSSKRKEAWEYLKVSFTLNQFLRDLKKHHRSTQAIRKNLTQLSKLHVRISQDLDESHTRDIVQLIQKLQSSNIKNDTKK